MPFDKLYEIDIDEFIKGIWESLRQAFKFMPEDKSFDEYTKQVREGIAIGSITDDWVNEPQSEYFGSNPLSLEYPFRRAIVLAELTQQALNRGDNLSFLALALKASAAVESASVHAEFQSMLNVPAALRRHRAEKGGAARAKTFQLARDHALVLIRDQRPEDGWDDITHAAETISEKLYQFIRNNNISLTQDRIVSNLKKWAKEDLIFRNALNSLLERPH